ncbi:MAG: hypothetical protein GOMPHAMPRED_005746 [Gomphillus americanus]|uniref:Uncharacterized protein n=1 Tax=Gomphillus americanus TaxID=1940652 RepID=A0A8H3FU93_9LECA|nr:MAG: hypothetical protein GOMPHAMPRED_005746 [Gomphillus americanus]
MSDYKPSEHDGLRKDGQQDQRMNNEFAGGKVDPVEAGRKGGQSSGGSSDGSDDSSGSTGGDYKPTDHGGLRKDGEPDGRVKGN